MHAAVTSHGTPTNKEDEMPDANNATLAEAAPIASQPDEWRRLPEGTQRVLAGNLCYVDQEMIQIGLGEGGAFNVAITPTMMFVMDMMLNPKFMLGVRRAILARSTHAGWEVSLLDVYDDVPGHGCPENVI